MLVLVCLFEHLPAGILRLCSVICMGVQSIPNSRIPEYKLFSTQCKAYIVWDLCDFLPLPVIIWLFIAKPGENAWQGKDAFCFLGLAPALMDRVNRLSGNAARTLCASELSSSSGTRGWHVKIKAN